MRNILKFAAVLGVTVTLAACGAPEEEMVIVPVQPEPTMGKF
jgi:hypothetical protein